MPVTFTGFSKIDGVAIVKINDDGTPDPISAWILFSGIWNDSGEWIDTEFWIDSL